MEEFEHKGSAITVDIAVTDSEGNVLTEGVDYSIEYVCIGCAFEEQKEVKRFACCVI